MAAEQQRPELSLDKVRFFIADQEDRPRSHDWYLRQEGANIYIGPRATGGAAKLSFHPPGQSRDGCDSQWGLTRPYADKERGRGIQIPQPVRWIRPAAPEAGVACAALIHFPTDFLGVVAPSDRTPGKTRLSIPMADAGHSTVVGIFYSREVPAELEDRFIAAGITPFVWTQLSSGEYVTMTAQQQRFPPTVIPSLRDLGRSTPLSGAPPKGEAVKNVHGFALQKRPDLGDPAILVEFNGLTLSRK